MLSSLPTLREPTSPTRLRRGGRISETSYERSHQLCYNKVMLKERYVVDGQGRKTAVVLDLKEYKKLLDWLETLEDTLDLDEAVRQARRFRDYQQIRQELKRAGRL